MAAPPARPSRFEVLVADDDPDIRDLLGEFFRDRELAVAMAHDGRAAISELEQSRGRYGMVVTDIGMPGADGFTVLTAARESCPGAYVVIMTGFATLESAVRAVRLGAHDYVTKPFSLGQIDVILDRAFLHSASSGARPRPSAAPSADLPKTLDSRLADIDARLSSIERTLGQILPLIGPPITRGR